MTRVRVLSILLVSLLAACGQQDQTATKDQAVPKDQAAKKDQAEPKPEPAAPKAEPPRAATATEGTAILDAAAFALLGLAEGEEEKRQATQSLEPTRTERTAAGGQVRFVQLRQNPYFQAINPLYASEKDYKYIKTDVTVSSPARCVFKFESVRRNSVGADRNAFADPRPPAVEQFDLTNARSLEISVINRPSVQFILEGGKTYCNPDCRNALRQTMFTVDYEKDHDAETRYIDKRRQAIETLKATCPLRS
jgi:hypothetical protein